MKGYEFAKWMGFTGIAVLMLIAAPVYAASNEVTEIKAATWHPMGHRLTSDAYKLIGEEIEKRSNGKVKFTWFLAGSLVKAPQTFDALMAGVIDFSIIANFSFLHLFPVTEGISLPFVIDGSAHAADVLWEMYQTVPEMKKEYSKMKVFGFFTTGIQNLLTKDRLVKTIEDFQGLRIAVIGAPQLKAIKLLGGSPHDIKGDDFYPALQRGMIDGAFFPDAAVRSYKLIELADKHTMANFWATPMTVAMRSEKWETLPPDIKKVFNDLTPSMGRLCGHTLENEGIWVVEELKKRGDAFYYLPPKELARWKEKISPLHGEWMNKLNSKGWNGQAVFNKMMAISEKWRKNPGPEDEWWKKGKIGKQ